MLAIARALMSRPKLLLLDEPSLGLAPLVCHTIFSTIDEIKAAGTTVLLVEQNANAALKHSDRGYVLETGAVSSRERLGDRQRPARARSVSGRVRGRRRDVVRLFTRAREGTLAHEHPAVLREQVANDRHGRGTGGSHGGRRLERDAADGDDRPVARTARRRRHQWQTNGCVASVLRSGAEDRADGCVGGRLLQSSLDLGQRMRRDADDCRVTEQQAGVGGGRSSCPEVNTRGA